MTGRPDQTIAVQTRNVAGFVTKRRSNVSSPMGYIESSWTYDRLGRITDQVVQKGPGATQVARQKLEYFGNDDPAALDHWIGPTNRKRFEYRYDLRHQLVNVAETAAGGAFSANYQYGTAGRFRRATETARSLPGSDVKPRDVTYQYAGTDPEQLTALRQPDGSTFASYEYDAAGNQTYRCEGVIRPTPGGNAGSQKNATCVGESLYLVYDGSDRLRRVIKYNGAARGNDEEYWYDNAGTRVATITHDGAKKKTELIWWLGDTEAHYDATGALGFVYSHATIGTVAARVRRSSTGASMEFQFHGLGKNTLAAVDRDSGAVNTAFVYAPFGEIVEASDSSSGTAVHRRRMNDKFVDEVSDLAYYGMRFYDKHSMTWVQADPTYRFAPDATWSQPRHALLYVAHLQNPLRYLDPDGRDVILVGSSQPKSLGLSTEQIRSAAGRAGSFSTMSTDKKATKVVNNADSANRALKGRSDSKVAYFGHGRSDSKDLDPSNGRSSTITPTQLAAAVAGMKQQPTDIYLYGCNTDDTGFAQDLADLLPGVTVHAYSGEFEVGAAGPTDKKGNVKKDEAVLNPTNPSQERSRKSGGSQKQAAPADANEDGRTTEQEESDWMRAQQ
jgi:RHS repeat-associated protein